MKGTYILPFYIYTKVQSNVSLYLHVLIVCVCAMIPDPQPSRGSLSQLLNLSSCLDDMTLLLASLNEQPAKIIGHV